MLLQGAVCCPCASILFQHATLLPLGASEYSSSAPGGPPGDTVVRALLLVPGRSLLLLSS